MSINKSFLRLYAVTDSNLIATNNPLLTLPQAIAQACDGGATMIQLREKNLSDDAFLDLAQKARKVTASRGIPLIINDRVEIAIKCGAEGVHIGQNDMPANAARAMIGKNRILGISAHNLSEARTAQAAGADYLGVGDIFGTSTKNDTKRISYDIIKQICSNVNIPVVAIGGINAERAKLLKGSGIAGVAAVSSIFAAKDIYEAAAELASVMQSVVNC